jgi:N-sulfoglucosamine sulfohydrolase
MTMTRRDVLRAAGLGATGAVLPGRMAAMAKPAKKRPNILLITSEDNGPEIGCYGDPYAQTPNLDKLAADGTRFANAYITNPVCSPSRGSIFTGLYPHQNGQIGLATHKYAMYRKWPNVVSLLKEAGYRTGIIGKIHVNPESAFACDFRGQPGSNFNMRDMRKYKAAAEKFLGAGEAPFFLMVNFPDAHFPLIRQYAGLPEKPLTGKDVKTLPFVGADNDRLREFTADYYNCLSRLDSGVGMVLDALAKAGRADDTLVIYLGDHGAQFSRGKTALYEGGVRVPFIVRSPGAGKAGVVRKELVSSIDILPTVLDATSVEGPKSLPGRSLLGLCADLDIPWREYVFTEKAGSTPFWTFPQRTIRDKRYKLIASLLQDRDNPKYEAYATHAGAFFKAGTTEAELASAPKEVRDGYATWKSPPSVELYDLKNDPHEWVNLAGKPEVADVQKRLVAALKAWQEETNDPFADPVKLVRYVDEMDTVTNDKVNYKKKDFRWKYLDYLGGPTGEQP